MQFNRPAQAADTFFLVRGTSTQARDSHGGTGVVGTAMLLYVGKAQIPHSSILLVVQSASATAIQQLPSQVQGRVQLQNRTCVTGLRIIPKEPQPFSLRIAALRRLRKAVSRIWQ